MTEHPYTRDDLIAEAASCREALSIPPTPDDIRRQLPDAYIDSHRTPSSGHEATWGAVVGDSSLDHPTDQIHALIEGAADVSAWAVQLGADGLEPEEHSITVSGNSRPIARIHFAFEPGMPDDMRTALVEGIGQAIADRL